MIARSLHMLVRTASALAVVLAIAGCTQGGQFDPTEVLAADPFGTKKKRPGEREPLFPSGVPGAESGVPHDLVKGYQPPPEQRHDPAWDQKSASPQQSVWPAPQSAPPAQQTAQPAQSVWPNPPAPSTSSR